MDKFEATLTPMLPNHWGQVGRFYGGGVTLRCLLLRASLRTSECHRTSNCLIVSSVLVPRHVTNRQRIPSKQR